MSVVFFYHIKKGAVFDLRINQNNNYFDITFFQYLGNNYDEKKNKTVGTEKIDKNKQYYEYSYQTLT